MHHSVILVVLLIRAIRRIACIAARQLHVGWWVHADARTIRNDALMVNLALVDALITTAAHVGYLARWQTRARLLLCRVRHAATHGLLDVGRGRLVVDILAAEAQRIVGYVLAGARRGRDLVRAAGDQARRLLLPINTALRAIVLQLFLVTCSLTALIHGLRQLRIIQVLID